ncbi:hypothetical protein ACFSQD_11080 [Flavihumibacter stibioxidans]|uniref:hypothetical protein n=1 Tax=Flavihumibacter stibioxidans TaxID=1834163 RepID=UPI00164F3C6A|nr:hypothetical protein [Flavihumibacter stibioxidans]
MPVYVCTELNFQYEKFSTGNIGTRYNAGLPESATIPVTRRYTCIFFANLFRNSYDAK